MGEDIKLGQTMTAANKNLTRILTLHCNTINLGSGDFPIRKPKMEMNITHLVERQTRTIQEKTREERPIIHYRISGSGSWVPLTARTIVLANPAVIPINPS